MEKQKRLRKLFHASPANTNIDFLLISGFNLPWIEAILNAISSIIPKDPTGFVLKSILWRIPASRLLSGREIPRMAAVMSNILILLKIK